MIKSDSYGPIKFELLGDGFLTVTIEGDVKELDFTLELAENIIERTLLILDGVPHPFLFLYREVTISMSDDASKLIANHAGLLKVKKAEAIVTKFLVNRLLVNFHTFFFKPLAPVKVFKEEADAKEWLKKFL